MPQQPWEASHRSPTSGLLGRRDAILNDHDRIGYGCILIQEASIPAGNSNMLGVLLRVRKTQLANGTNSMPLPGRPQGTRKQRLEAGRVLEERQPWDLPRNKLTTPSRWRSGGPSRRSSTAGCGSGTECWPWLPEHQREANENEQSARRQWG